MANKIGNSETYYNEVKTNLKKLWIHVSTCTILYSIFYYNECALPRVGASLQDLFVKLSMKWPANWEYVYHYAFYSGGGGGLGRWVVKEGKTIHHGWNQQSTKLNWAGVALSLNLQSVGNHCCRGWLALRNVKAAFVEWRYMLLDTCVNPNVL